MANLSFDQRLLLESRYSEPSMFRVHPEDNATDYDDHPDDKLFDGLVDIPDEAATVDMPEGPNIKVEDGEPYVDMSWLDGKQGYAASGPSSYVLPTPSWTPMPLMDNSRTNHVAVPYCCCGGNHWHDNDNQSYPAWNFGSYGNSDGTHSYGGAPTDPFKNEGQCPLHSNQSTKVQCGKKGQKSHPDTKKEPKERSNTPPSPVIPVTQMRFQTIPGYQKSRRTKTSYDPKTSFRLNRLFFESFGTGRKPTKDERNRIQKKTGITSRRLTYWLSNHKRRFAAEIGAYKRLSDAGVVSSYDTFLDYCNKHYIPEIDARGATTTTDEEGGDDDFDSETEK